MEKIAKFFECLIPVTCCNLKCEYCYVHQQQRQLGMMPTFKYSPKQIAAAFDKERMGGACYISICGSGETLLVKEVVDIVAELVKAGHYVNITNNGTVTRELERLISSVDSFLRDRVLLSFSLHYLELKKLGLLSVFAANVKKVHEAGFPIYVKLNLFNGGGTFGDIWPRAPQFRMSVMLENPKCRYLVFPQTICYADEYTMCRDAAFFGQYNCTICARDEVSYELFRKYFSNDILLLPDMAFCIDMKR